MGSIPGHSAYIRNVKSRARLASSLTHEHAPTHSAATGVHSWTLPLLGWALFSAPAPARTQIARTGCPGRVPCTLGGLLLPRYGPRRAYVCSPLGIGPYPRGRSTRVPPSDGVPPAPRRSTPLGSASWRDASPGSARRHPRRAGGAQGPPAAGATASTASEPRRGRRVVVT